MLQRCRWDKRSPKKANWVVVEVYCHRKRFQRWKCRREDCPGETTKTRGLAVQDGRFAQLGIEIAVSTDHETNNVTAIYQRRKLEQDFFSEDAQERHRGNRSMIVEGNTTLESLPRA